MLFGPKSERHTSSQTQAIQASLFAELEAIKLKEEQLAAQQTKTVTYERKVNTTKTPPARASNQSGNPFYPFIGVYYYEQICGPPALLSTNKNV